MQALSNQCADIIIGWIGPGYTGADHPISGANRGKKTDPTSGADAVGSLQGYALASIAMWRALSLASFLQRNRIRVPVDCPQKQQKNLFRNFSARFPNEEIAHPQRDADTPPAMCPTASGTSLGHHSTRRSTLSSEPYRTAAQQRPPLASIPCLCYALTRA